MFVGRRMFLRLSAMATAVAAATPSVLAGISGNRYSNRRLGLSLTKPDGWSFLSVVDFNAAADHQLVHIDHPEVLDILRAPEAVPFLAVAKYGAGYDDLNPCFTCWDEPIEPDWGDARACHVEALDGWARFLSEVDVATEPTPFTMTCGTAATFSAWSFRFDHDSGRTWPVRVRTLLLHRGMRMQTFHFMDGVTPGADASDELKRVAASLTYDR